MFCLFLAQTLTSSRWCDVTTNKIKVDSSFAQVLKSFVVNNNWDGCIILMTQGRKSWLYRTKDLHYHFLKVFISFLRVIFNLYSLIRFSRTQRLCWFFLLFGFQGFRNKSLVKLCCLVSISLEGVLQCRIEYIKWVTCGFSCLLLFSCNFLELFSDWNWLSWLPLTQSLLLLVSNGLLGDTLKQGSLVDLFGLMLSQMTLQEGSGLAAILETTFLTGFLCY